MLKKDYRLAEFYFGYSGAVSGQRLATLAPSLDGTFNSPQLAIAGPRCLPVTTRDLSFLTLPVRCPRLR